MRRRFTYKNNSWNVDRYLTIVSLEDGLTVSFENDLEYCINNDYNWEILKKGEESKEIDKGNRISFRANLTPTDGIGTFTINKKCNLEGNCGSLLYGNLANLYDYVSSYSFYNLFYGCDTIKEVSPYLLPFTKLGNSCYDGMFVGCTSLVNAPELPATTLAQGCYISMFEGCTSLVNAPELPATTLASWCYIEMFNGCSNLNYIKMLATDISATNCLRDWVYGVSSTGTFVKSKDATWDVRGASGIPEGWTVKTDDEESGVNLISFTIKMNPFVPSMGNYPQQTYQAVEGMTWVEWCASEYNINGFIVVEIEAGKKVEHNYDGFVIDGGSSINANDIIISDGVYYYE